MLAELNTIAKNYEYLIKAVGAFLPFLIAIFMAYVAWQQWQTNERKRRQDLFDKRWAFYIKMRELFELIGNDQHEFFEETDFFRYDTRADEALFLFGKDIQEHVFKIGNIAKTGNYDLFSTPFEKYLCLEHLNKKQEAKNAN